MATNDGNGNRSKQKSGGGGFQNLSDELYRGIVSKMGFKTPTPTQRKSLPLIMSGKDTVVMARTGSGKTAAFCIPLLELYLRRKSSNDAMASNIGQKLDSTRIQMSSCFAVILSPTRELSQQTHRVLKMLSHFIDSFSCIGINGGESMDKQFSLLSTNPTCIVATPGRLAHHLSEIPDFNLRCCEYLVLDEADRLFEMGFMMQIRQICSHMRGPEEGRQTTLFSATMPKVLIEFTKCGLMDDDPHVVRLDKEANVSEELRIGFFCVKSNEKDGALLHLLRDILNASLPNERSKLPKMGLTLIFAATRHHVDYLLALINRAGLNNSYSGEDSSTQGDVASSIYGSMDQEARKINLHSFRSGKTPILIVTDVAARGIDIPLIDHVIHYTFPACPKLFVHRSGRAGRKRIGYCWGIVDAEEMPYMVDLYLFLGRRLCSGRTSEEVGHANNADTSLGLLQDEYTMEEMTNEMVHYGRVPESVMTEEVENVRRIVESELSRGHDTDVLQSLIKVCENAMKQYRRSRPEASKEGIRRSKEILEGSKQKSGKRVGVGLLPIHPVLYSLEKQRIYSTHRDADGSGKSAEKKMKELQDREMFLNAISEKRPRETIFETFGNGGSTTSSISSHIDKGRTTSSMKKNDCNMALVAMKNMRRQMKFANDKGTSMVVAGSKQSNILNGDLPEVENIDVSPNNKAVEPRQKDSQKVIHGKRRLSKAERRRQRKNCDKEESQSTNPPVEEKKVAKNKRGTDFRDETYYISNGITTNMEEVNRERQKEAALQPSSSMSKGSIGSSLRLEEALLDIVGDENVDMVKKRKMMRWDKSKGKYIQTTLGEELSGVSRSKRIRLESGKLVKKDKMKAGELYDKWQKKTNKNIGRVGVFDEVGADESATYDRQGEGNVNDTLKTASEIRKARELSKKNKLKNMKKSERSRIEMKRKMSDSANSANGKGYQGKKGYSGRWRK